MTGLSTVYDCPAHPNLSTYFSESQSIDHYLVLNAGSESESVICRLEQTILVDLHSPLFVDKFLSVEQNFCGLDELASSSIL